MTWKAATEKLEPELHDAHGYDVSITISLYSIAISLKRIADIMEQKQKRDIQLDELMAVHGLMPHVPEA